jgi:proton glutamate symport protein
MASSAAASGSKGTRLIFLGLVAGVLLGGFLPQDRYPWAYDLFRFLSKAFLRLVKSVVAPIVFATLVSGMVQVGSGGNLGRLGARAFVYFEVVTTIALFLGLGVAHLVAPGIGLPLDTTALRVTSSPSSSSPRSSRSRCAARVPTVSRSRASSTGWRTSCFGTPKSL